MSNEPSAKGAAVPTAETTSSTESNSRRRFFVVGTQLLGFLLTLLVAIPGVAYFIDPLRRKSKSGAFRKLGVTLGELEVGVPRVVPVIDEREDAWVKYPDEPIGTVWLVRQKEGADAPVIAFTAECPHLGCAVGLAPNGASFYCPCHQSAFKLDGTPTNDVPPRGMDKLEVKPPENASDPIEIRFQRFRTQSPEKIPLA